MEVSVELKPPPRAISRKYYQRIDPPLLSHLVLQLTLNSGRQFVVDITGAQYGFHDPVISWKKFTADRMAKITMEKPFGWMKERSKDTDWLEHGFWKHINMYPVTDEAVKVLDDWLVSNMLTSKRLLRTSSAVYERQSAILFSHIKQEITSFITRAKHTSQLVVMVRSYMEGLNRGTGMILTKGDGSEEKVETGILRMNWARVSDAASMNLVPGPFGMPMRL
jgi:hypothetical protein